MRSLGPEDAAAWRREGARTTGEAAMAASNERPRVALALRAWRALLRREA